MTLSRLIFAGFSLLVAGATSSMQAQSGSYTVENTSNERLGFDVFDPAVGQWKAYTLGPHMQRPITLQNASSDGKIRVATPGQGSVVYAARSGELYRLSWSASKRVWDLKTVRHAAPANASNPAGPNGGSQAESGSYTVENMSNERLSFDTYDPGVDEWRTQTLGPHMQRAITLQRAAAAGKIRIKTPGHGTVEYATRNAWVYRLAWSERKGVWDLTTVRR